MKTACTVVLLSIFAAMLPAQENGVIVSDQKIVGNQRQQNGDAFRLLPDSAEIREQPVPTDTILYNMYGNLREDNPKYSPKSPLWLCALRLVAGNGVTWAADRYVLNAEFARISPTTWKHNVQTGWEWDTDRFGMNYFFHPYSGSANFNAARSNGYNFYESVPFALAGSLMWEYFGENTLPSFNDVVNTTVTGAFLGEISYRLSSNFLDDRTTGSERVWRELFAGFINPSRFVSRLLQGKFFRVTTEEIYQKEPLNMTFSAGARWANDGRDFATGPMSESLTLNLDYGNPFERRTRKIFDYFKLRADLNFGAGRKVIDNIIGHGILFGGNSESGGREMLTGVFQHYDFWDNKTFELGTIAFGGGILTKLPISKSTNFFASGHLGIVPLAGNSTRLGPDTSQFRDYNYGGGLESKLEGTLNLGGWASLTLRAYYYWIHTYIGNAGDNFIGIIKPSIQVSLFSNFSLGFEHLVYTSDRYPRDYPNIHDVRTEQKIFLQYYIDNFKHEK